MSGEYQPKLPSFLDELTDAAIGIDYPHHEIHEGSAFVCDFADMVMADTDTIIFAFKSMAAPVRAHLAMEFTTLVGGNLELWQGATWTAETGAEAPIINRNLGSSNSSGLLANQAQAGFVAADVLVVNPTGLNTGGAESVHHIYAWGSQSKGSTGGNRDTEELILKPDTAYALVFTGAGANNAGQVIMNWYESTDRSA